MLTNLIISCCPDPTNVYYKIIELKIGNCILDKLVEDSSIVDIERFRILVDIKANSFVNYNTKFSTISSAYAFKCENNYVGLKSDINEFTVSCNKDILGVSAGQPISFDKMNIYKIGFYDDSKNQRQTIYEWMKILNNGGYRLAFEWYIEFKEQVISKEYLTFKIKIHQEDGSEFIAETKSIKLE